jgi:RNA polymerase sigma-70 factor (ECF subfamily)
MVFNFEKYSAKAAAKQMSKQCLQERQRDVYESHRHRVFSVSYYMTGSEIEAEELLQDTFISAFQRTPEPDQETVDAAMLEQIRERLQLEEAEAPPIPKNVYLPGGRNILRADLEEAIRCLPPAERLVFLLMDVEGYGSERIAALVGTESAEVVRTAVRARLRLRAEIATLRQNRPCAA